MERLLGEAVYPMQCRIILFSMVNITTTFHSWLFYDMHMTCSCSLIISQINDITIILGISISGGRGSTQQPEIRIETVYPGGAVAEVGVLKVRWF